MERDKRLVIIERISREEDDSLLDEIYAILEQPHTAGENDASDDLKNSIQQGLSEADEGKMLPHDEVWPEMLKFIYASR